MCAQLPEWSCSSRHSRVCTPQELEEPSLTSLGEDWWWCSHGNLSVLRRLIDSVIDSAQCNLFILPLNLSLFFYQGTMRSQLLHTWKVNNITSLKWVNAMYLTRSATKSYTQEVLFIPPPDFVKPQKQTFPRTKISFGSIACEIADLFRGKRLQVNKKNNRSWWLNTRLSLWRPGLVSYEAYCYIVELLFLDLFTSLLLVSLLVYLYEYLFFFFLIFF